MTKTWRVGNLHIEGDTLVQFDVEVSTGEKKVTGRWELVPYDSLTDRAPNTLSRLEACEAALNLNGHHS